MRESALLTGRGLRTIARVPARLSDVTLQPVVFTLPFLYVFGSAIHVPGMRYQNYLIPRMIAQTVAFGVISSGVATATDFRAGVIDRFTSLPVTRLAVITAQLAGQMIEQLIGMIIVAALGLALGWRPHLSPASGAALAAIIVLGLLAFTTVGILLGMTLGSADAVEGIGFAIVFPLAFLGGTFVPHRLGTRFEPTRSCTGHLRTVSGPGLCHQGQHAAAGNSRACLGGAVPRGS